MTTVGFIGSGKIGSTVARLAVAAGHEVVLSNSRGPQTLTELVSEVGPLARAGTVEQAADAGELVVVSVPFKAFRDLPVERLAGKVVLDTNNYYPKRDGQIAELDEGAVTSAELEQRFLGSARVVKVFNNIFYLHLGSLARPAGAADRTALTIAGDDRRPTRRRSSSWTRSAMTRWRSAPWPTVGGCNLVSPPTACPTAASTTPPAPRRASTPSAPPSTPPGADKPARPLVL